MSGELNSDSERIQGSQLGVILAGSLFPENWVSLLRFKLLDSCFFFFFNCHLSLTCTAIYLVPSRVREEGGGKEFTWYHLIPLSIIKMGWRED